MEAFRTLSAAAEGRVVEKKSEFIGHAAPATTEAEALSVLAGVKAAHRTANHNVYAYTLQKESRQRYSDDGEPAKTAGLPVLSVFTHAGLSDCIIVVTRYFGGVLLGTGGLVRAYTAAAQAALQAAEIVTVRRCVRLTVTVAYPLYEGARRLLEAAGARLEEPIFTDSVTVIALLPAGNEVSLLEGLQNLSRGAAAVQVSDAFFTPFADGRPEI